MAHPNTSPATAAPPGAEPDPHALQTRQRIGARLRRYRVEQGLTLREAAERSGLSRSFISMVENATTEIAVSRLIKLADAYGAMVADVLSGVTPRTATAEFARPVDARHLPSDSADIDIRYLTSSAWPLQPFTVTVGAGGRLEDLSHKGTEFLHCLSGTMLLVVEGTNYVLEPGDTLVVPDHAEHSYINASDGVTRLIGCVERS